MKRWKHWTLAVLLGCLVPLALVGWLCLVLRGWPPGPITLALVLFYTVLTMTAVQVNPPQNAED